MSAGFGFSASDFIAGIKLIADLIKALEESTGASAEYCHLIKELYSLERALVAIKHLKTEESTQLQTVAVEQAVRQCQQCIDDFLHGIAKFQPKLASCATGFKANLRKIQWSLCKKGDVEKFSDANSRPCVFNQHAITHTTNVRQIYHTPQSIYHVACC